MDPLDFLEKRIAALELQVLPKNPRFPNDGKTQDITEILLQTQTMISSALCCREAITSILQHMTTINSYLDPNNGESELEVEVKRHYLLELYPELKDIVKLVSTFESLTAYADSEGIARATGLTNKLEDLAAFNLKMYEESQIVTNRTVDALQQYNDIITSIKVLFAQLDKGITDHEAALMPKLAKED